MRSLMFENALMIPYFPTPEAHSPAHRGTGNLYPSKVPLARTLFARTAVVEGIKARF